MPGFCTSPTLILSVPFYPTCFPVWIFAVWPLFISLLIFVLLWTHGFFPCSLSCYLGHAAQILALFSLFSPSPSALYVEAGGLTHTPGGKPSHHRGVKINCTYKYVIWLLFHSCFRGFFRQLLLMGQGGKCYARRRGNPCWAWDGRWSSAALGIQPVPVWRNWPFFSDGV